jgi:hypothetical protein
MKHFLPLIIISILILITGCSKSKDDTEQSIIDQKPIEEPVPENLEPIDFKDLPGKWALRFSGNYGYEFRFNKSYKALVIIYLGSSSLLFNGVYTIENGNLKINIYEMKNEDRSENLNIYSNFIKAKSSYFLFKAGINKKPGTNKMLVLRPSNIIIDGINSDGYFEPVIKLKPSP